uniref:RIKEN cDNA 6030468B19 gene n=1 Tax=Nannospalax galili TaxID=1026970 RepID=A0A8C6R161_NANGA
MRLPGLLCVAMLDITIAYKVLEVYPQSRLVRITCEAPKLPQPITYSLLASRGILVAKKVVHNSSPALFNINITLKSSPDLLTYFCQAASNSITYGPSTRLQMYWELWTKPVSQLQANFTLQDGDLGPTVELSCLASSGSPPITYRLIGNDGRVYAQQKPLHGQPASFSLPLTRMSGWFRCQAENRVGVQNSPRTLLPPAQLLLTLTGELSLMRTVVTAGSLISIASIGSGMLGWTRL